MCWAVSKELPSVGTDRAANSSEHGGTPEPVGELESIGSWRWHVRAWQHVSGTVLWKALDMVTAWHFRGRRKRRQ